VSEQFWSGDFGKQYTARNRVQWSQRVPFWQGIIESRPLWPHNILEVGCNAGWNLNAIRHVDPNIELVGVDVCPEAVDEAAAAGHDVYVMPASQLENLEETFDIVFTAGVLIHVPHHELDGVMDAIIAASHRDVLAIEYAADQEEAVEYRGHSDKLWRRPFGALYEAKGLTLVETGNAGPGFDRCTYWLMRKP
jgi:pseudaminic acid biosynthesis-associated methylase